MTTEAKSQFGKFAYYFNAITRVKDLKEFDLKFFENDSTLFSGPCLAFTVGNAAFAGGGLKIAPEAKLDDGALDLLIIPSQSLVNLASLALEMMKAEPDFSRHGVIYRQLNSFSVEATETLPINLDGEPMSDTRFDFQTLERAIEVAVPSETHILEPGPGSQPAFI